MSITTDAVAHSRFALSRDVVQASYRLLAVALLCAALTALSDVSSLRTISSTCYDKPRFCS